MRRRWLFVGALLIVLVLFHWGWLGNFSGLPVVSAVVDAIDRGLRLTTTTPDDDGNIPDSPASLAAAAAAVAGVPVSVDAYGLARMVRNEQPHDSDGIKALLCHTMINDAAAHGWTVIHTLTVSSVPSRSGKFGKQTSRRCSTTHDPYGADLTVAQQAIADHAAGNDPTGGAQKFVNKWAFKKPESYDTTLTSWAKEGFVPVTIPPAPNHLVFFRKQTAPSSPVADASSDNAGAGPTDDSDDSDDGASA
jgi:hypothetical protein